MEDDLFGVLGMEAQNFFRTEHSDSGNLRGVEVVFGAFALQNEEFERVVWKDFTWAFLSLLSVWLYMMFHLGSFFLSCVGAFEVFMSFPTGLFFYRTIFGVGTQTAFIENLLCFCSIFLLFWRLFGFPCRIVAVVPFMHMCGA